eukprot:TRINITY_DN4758_c0_g1_i18.p2 TRINITY_DN4758_c0_g1~~TRINITY_DN4758_c0_g1_i18.p2  ORF type:complete len:103 (+),score=7.30 TRINITY_DN4758_c0_g1_i18:407-715(+)
MTSARGVEHSKLSAEVHALTILKNTLAGSDAPEMFKQELSRIDTHTLDRWLAMLLRHSAMYGKLVSLNEACTQVLQRTDAAILRIADEAREKLNCDRASVFA